MVHRLIGCVTLAGLLVAVGCGGSPTAPSPDLQGGVVATFDVSGQRFKVFVTSPATISQLLALQRGDSQASIPNGPILRGRGAGEHNAPYDWHLDPAATEMAEAAIELCDGAPNYVQAHIADYVDIVGRYCPWGASLVSLEDYR